MPSRALPKSVRATAAASVLACTAGLATEHAEAEVLPVWIDAPHIEGTTNPVSPFFDVPVVTADFDQDGQDDFYIYFYFASPRFYELVAGSSNLNPDADVFYQSGSASMTTPGDRIFWKIRPEVFNGRDEVYAAGQTYVPLPRPLTAINSSGIQQEFSQRGILGGQFEGSDGITYIAYLDMELTVNEDDASLCSAVVYDAGYALLEPLLGDLDFDGDIDFDDINIGAANFTGHSGSTFMTPADGDTDGDGDVDNKDLGYLLGAYTGPLSLSDSAYAYALDGVAAVPEPSSLAVLAGASLIVLRRRRR
ncbi:MAG: PEP-CTERM sorting domain-containing protein [Phycisphaeraceae bacterium]